LQGFGPAAGQKNRPSVEPSAGTAPLLSVGVESAAEVGEAVDLGFLELIEDGLTFGDRESDEGKAAVEPVRDDPGGAESVGLAVGDEIRDEPARVGVGDRDSEEAEHALVPHDSLAALEFRQLLLPFEELERQRLKDSTRGFPVERGIDRGAEYANLASEPLDVVVVGHPLIYVAAAVRNLRSEKRRRLTRPPFGGAGVSGRLLDPAELLEPLVLLAEQLGGREDDASAGSAFPVELAVDDGPKPVDVSEKFDDLNVGVGLVGGRHARGIARDRAHETGRA